MENQINQNQYGFSVVRWGECHPSNRAVTAGAVNNNGDTGQMNSGDHGSAMSHRQKSPVFLGFTLRTEFHSLISV